MKTILLISLFFASLRVLKAQSINKVSYLEIGGPGLLSANFDTRFRHQPNGLGLRIGFGYATDVFSSGLSIPAGLNYLVGKNRHFFEVEGGVSFIHLFANNDDGWFKENAQSLWIGYAYAGYRYKGPYGFIFRAGFSPLYGGGHIVPWGSISFGHSL